MKYFLFLPVTIFFLAGIYLWLIFGKQKEQNLKGKDEIYFFLKKFVSTTKEKLTYVAIFDLSPESNHPIFKVMRDYPDKIQIVKPAQYLRMTSSIGANFILSGNLLYAEKAGGAVVIENPVKWMKKNYTDFMRMLQEEK